MRKIYLTEGDTLMPQFDVAQWRERSAQAFGADDRNPYDYKLTVYDRIQTYCATQSTK